MNSADAERAVLSSLHFLVSSTAATFSEENVHPDVLSQLSHLSHKVRVARDIVAAKGDIRIGVFGLPNRGKSTLVNALIGSHFMPEGFVPMTSSVVEVRHNPERKIELEFSSGRQDAKQDCLDEESVLNAVTKFGSKRGRGDDGDDSNSAERITIYWPLSKSRLLKKGYMLVDTPGAEKAFEDGSTDTDTQRALAALERTHVVLFCMRADQLNSEREVEFCRQHMEMLDPLYVINMMDKYDEEREPDPAKVLTNQVFWIDAKKAVKVCSRYGVESRRSSDDELWNKSRLEELENRIEQIIKDLSPDKTIPLVLEQLQRHARKQGFLPEYAPRGGFAAAVMSPEYLNREGVLRMMKRFPDSWFEEFFCEQR